MHDTVVMIAAYRCSALFAAVLAIAACSRSESSQPPPAASETHAPSSEPVAKDPAQARTMIANGAVVIDVRTPDEFATGHVPNAVNIPVQELPSRFGEVDKLVHGEKGAPIVVYCKSGGRAAKAKTALDAAGYEKVVNGGGFKDLAAQP
jgi:phage shock protein E